MPKRANTKKNTRRANNEGSVYQRKDGRWCSQITVGYKTDGKPDRKTVYAWDQQELLQKLKTLSLDILTNGYEKQVIVNRTFYDAYMEWLLNFKKHDVASRTFEGYIFRAKKHVLTIGKKQLSKIQSIDVQTNLNHMVEKGLGLDIRMKVYNDFNQFFQYAVTEGMIKINPMQNVKRPKEVRRERTDGEDYMAIPVDKRPMIIESLDERRYFYLKPILLTMMFAGLRIGELIALKWKNIDFDKSVIVVDSSMNRVTEFDDEGNIIGRSSQISDTKTLCSVRRVPINQFLLNTLKQWHKYLKSQEDAFGVDYTAKNSVVFPTEDGDKRSYSGARMMIKRFNTRCGFDNYHAHTYRHTFATMLFEQNVNPKVVQKLMGHRDIKTTLKIYTSINHDDLSSSVALIDPEYIRKII